MQTAKYGASIRKMVDKSIKSKKARYECPKCHKLKVMRKCNAMWACRGCDAEFAGAAYSFRSEAGEIAARVIGEYSKTS
ncbi:MAG: 50S ribosomal protein L37ae [Candidatus Micrarchaeota archaeon]